MTFQPPKHLQRLASLGPAPTFLCSLLAGALYAAGFPIKGLPPLGFPTIIGLYLLMGLLSNALAANGKFPLKKLILVTLGFSLGHYQLGFYWIPYTLREFGGLIAPFNYLAGLGFSAVIVPQLWSFFLGLYFIRQKEWLSKISANPALLAGTLTLLESFIPQQFPAHAGHVWMALPALTRLAPLFGAPFYSFITYYLIFRLVMLNTRRDYTLSASLIVLVLGANFLAPQMWQNTATSSTVKIKLVQPNVGNFMKIASEAGDNLALRDVFTRYLELSQSEQEAQLIVWPETAYPRLMQSKQKNGDTLMAPNLIRKVIELSGADLLTGGYDHNPQAAFNSQFESEYNTAFLFAAKDLKLAASYHKMNLIPFGEGLPFGPLNGFLSQYITNISYFAKGDDHTLFHSQRGSRFITPICYEILFDSFIRDYLNANAERPHFILNLTNDSWYGITSEPYQHLFLAKWRASEFQLPLVRMTNTGISSVLYPGGHESERLELNQALSKVYEVELKETTPTLFQKIGLWGVLLFIGFFGVLEFMRAKSPL